MIHKRDNRGFSLVELIIVIAIMAILIGVLAPAYLRYVEKARKSSDSDAIATCLNAIETVVIDPEYAEDIDSNTVIHIKIKKENNDAKLMFVAMNDDGVTDIKILDNVETAIANIIGNYTFKSQDWKAHAQYDFANTMDLIDAKITSNGHLEYDLLNDFTGADTLLANFSPVLEAKINNSRSNSNK